MIRFVQIPPGRYKMGGGIEEQCADALPRHEVELRETFEITAEPVSYEAFDMFCRLSRGSGAEAEKNRGYVAGMSWYEAQAFCEWLNTPEGANLVEPAGGGDAEGGSCFYRLPTEAEWEYCARNAGPFGVDRMCDHLLREWCLDWYAPYTDRAVTDPQGHREGMFKVVRGGFLDSPDRYNEYPLDVWRRGSLPPNYRHDPLDTHNDFGRHNIGFRVVRVRRPVTDGPGKNPASAAPRRVPTAVAEKDLTPPAAEAAALKPIVTLFVKQNNNQDKTQLSGKETRPYFRKRYVFTVPPDNSTHEEIAAFGLDPVLRHHHHSPGFTVCPNGDLLVSIYSSYHEYDAEAGLAATRLRYGAEEWDLPGIFINPVGVNDHAPMLVTTGDGVVHHFWGWQQLPNSYPFQFISSGDNGATWGPVRFPRFVNKAEAVVRQPINTAFHTRDGTFYLACDSAGGEKGEACSVLWRTKDMEVWENPQGRTAGRHTTAVELGDGSLLALGGKNSDIGGYMPQALSRDRGDTWEVSATPFPALSSGQRPCVLRLQSGKLLLCGDYQNKQGHRPYPPGDRRWGSYVAYSGDDGVTWTFKTLPGTQPRKKDPDLFGGAHTLGYSVCRQSADGLIHIITSNNQPCLHLCFNEAWLLSPSEDAGKGDAELMRSAATRIDRVKTYREYYPGGALKSEYSGGTADDGRFLLHGPERWYYPSGIPMMECCYVLGNRTGRYVYYGETGARIWEWDYKAGGLARYRTFYPGEADGCLKSDATFRNRFAEGNAQTFARNGELLKEVWYEHGGIIRVTNLRKETLSPIGEVYMP
jgi:hypothetical protein